MFKYLAIIFCLFLASCSPGDQPIFQQLNTTVEIMTGGVTKITNEEMGNISIRYILQGIDVIDDIKLHQSELQVFEPTDLQIYYVVNKYDQPCVLYFFNSRWIKSEFDNFKMSSTMPSEPRYTQWHCRLLRQTIRFTSDEKSGTSTPQALQ